MNFTIYTLSFDFEKDYKVVIGYRILGMQKNELLGAAFTYDGDWKTFRFYLGEFENEFSNPEEELVHMFFKFLETLRIHFIEEKFDLRRESNGWRIKQSVFHELVPSKIELDRLDKNYVVKRIDYISKLSGV